MIEAEQTIIGAVLRNPRSYDDVAPLIAAGDLYAAAHRAIWLAIGSLAATSQPIDVVTVAERLQATDELERIGGLPYLGQLVDMAPLTGNPMAYARIVRDSATRRRLIATAEQIRVLAEEKGDVRKQLDQAQALILGLGEQNASGEPKNMRQVLAAAVGRIEVAATKGSDLGIRTGLRDLDAMTGGMHPGQLWIVAGRPSMGKTSLATGIGDYVAAHTGTVLLCSLETSDEALGVRMLASETELSVTDLRAGRVDSDGVDRLTAAAQSLEARRMWIDDDGYATVTTIRAKARRLKRQHGLSLLVIDYLQLMTGEGDNREQEIASISRGLKQLAKELAIPVIALSQLSRKVEERPNKRPLMSDIRESGAIEQDADVIVFVYREEYYQPTEYNAGIAELILAKQKDGATGTVYAQFDGAKTAFRNLAHGFRPRQPEPQIKQAARRRSFEDG